MFKMDENERGLTDFADSAGAGDDALKGGLALCEQAKLHSLKQRRARRSMLRGWVSRLRGRSGVGRLSDRVRMPMLFLASSRPGWAARRRQSCTAPPGRVRVLPSAPRFPGSWHTGTTFADLEAGDRLGCGSG